MSVRSLAAGHTKITVFATEPGATDAAKKALPLSTFTGTGPIDASCRIVASTFKLGATDDETVNEPALCDVVSADVPTQSKYDGQMDIFRYFNEDGQPDEGAGGEIGDKLYAAASEMGTTLFIARRDTSKLATENWATGDPYKLFEVITGTPQESPQDGYIKTPVKLYVQRAWDGVIASA